jgi:ABC-type glycerol-3-phosphate transport system permease component
LKLKKGKPEAAIIRIRNLLFKYFLWLLVLLPLKLSFFLSFKNRKQTEENIESTNIGRISQNKLIENSINYWRNEIFDNLRKESFLTLTVMKLTALIFQLLGLKKNFKKSWKSRICFLLKKERALTKITFFNKTV